ncbi:MULTISPECIES: NAD-dependent epimerase/dehydratase family protein [Campylobacter]|uniref:NAD-dependent epimerase/dehydratase family protein n=1 Tax=Campylobacter TaxID=194 RepID=UPI0015D93A20|nr:NAD-dependent epimerase/dehydratase family protein [Campylobacter sp. P0024]MCR8679294.1 NAD-dependent epimerase/dehydratase family protein [Campylobacter sp. RM19072]
MSQDDHIKYLNSDLNNLKIDFKFNYLIHTATYGQPKKVLENRLETVLLNTQTLINLLEKCKEYKAKVLFLSSSSVYGEIDKKHLPTSENHSGYLNSFDLGSLYAQSKRMAELICKIYIESEVEISIARIAIAYGPGFKIGDKRFLNELINQAMNSRRIILQDKGQAKRQLNFITDCIEMLLNIFINTNGEVYNIAGVFDENQNRILDFANTIGHLMNASVELPKISDDSLNAQSIVNLDISKYLSKFKKRSFVSLEEGLKLNIKWMKILKERENELTK